MKTFWFIFAILLNSITALAHSDSKTHDHETSGPVVLTAQPDKTKGTDVPTSPEKSTVIITPPEKSTAIPIDQKNESKEKNSEGIFDRLLKYFK